MQFKREIEIENLLNDNYTMGDLYIELYIIQNINHSLSPTHKIETLRNNFDAQVQKINLNYMFII